MQFAETVRTRKFLISKLLSKYRFLEEEGRWVESYRLKKTLERVIQRTQRKKWDLPDYRRSQSAAPKECDFLLPSESTVIPVYLPYQNCVTIEMPSYETHANIMTTENQPMDTEGSVVSERKAGISESLDYFAKCNII